MLDQENEELSPFVIPQGDVDVLNASEAFCMLRNYLARDTRYVLMLFKPIHLILVGLQQALTDPSPASVNSTMNAMHTPKKHGSYNVIFCMRW